MIGTAILITYATVVLGLFLIPGPAVLLTLARATAAGRGVGIATGLGVAAGDFVRCIMASFGLSAVLMTSALAFDVVKFAGAAYLLFLGVRALLKRTVTSSCHCQLGRGASSLSPRGGDGAFQSENRFVLPCLPAQFVRPEQGFTFGQFVQLGLIFVGMSAAYISLVALAAGEVSRWLVRHKRIGRWQGRVVGMIYITLGLRLAMEER